MLAMADALQLRGHEVALAVQRYAELPAVLPGMPIFQAPVWPGLFSDHAQSPVRAATMIDIFGRLGLNRPRVLKHLLTGWDSIFAAYRPDLVIGDYAPALLVAAQGRLPSIATGSGFQVLDDRDPVSRLGGGEPGYGEAEMLDILDADLREAGRQPLEHLGALFRCTRPIVASFKELDPYRRHDDGLFCAPQLSGWASAASVQGNEVFVYVNGYLSNVEALWRGLAHSGLPIRTFVPLIEPQMKTLLLKLGIIVEPAPVDWKTIARRSRIIVSHGAHGTMCTAMLAGLPHLVFYGDLEKGLHGRAMTEIGMGVLCNADTITPEQLGERIRALYDDEAMAAHTRAASLGFQARMTPAFETSIADAVDALL